MQSKKMVHGSFMVNLRRHTHPRPTASYEEQTCVAKCVPLRMSGKISWCPTCMFSSPSGNPIIILQPTRLYIDMHTNMFFCIYVRCAYTYAIICIYTCVYIYIYYTYYTCIHIYMQYATYVYNCMYIYIYMRVCVCVCSCYIAASVLRSRNCVCQPAWPLRSFGFVVSEPNRIATIQNRLLVGGFKHVCFSII